MKLENTADRLTNGDIERIEAKFEVFFPNEYRNFLLRNNGGIPKPSWYLVNDEYEDEISYFLAIDADDRHSDLAKQIENYRDWILPTYIPIAVCGGGDVLCLSLKNHDFGSVYHWNHGLVNVAGKPWEDNMTKLAGSLTDFLGSVSTLEDLESRWLSEGADLVRQPQIKPWWKFW